MKDNDEGVASATTAPVTATVIGTSNTRSATYYRIQVCGRAGVADSSVLRTLSDFRTLHAELKRERPASAPALPWMLSTSLMTSSQLARMSYLGSYLSKLLETDAYIGVPALMQFLELPGHKLLVVESSGSVDASLDVGSSSAVTLPADFGSYIFGGGSGGAAPVKASSLARPPTPPSPPPPPLPAPSALLEVLRRAAALDAASSAVYDEEVDGEPLGSQLLCCSAGVDAPSPWVAAWLSPTARSSATLLVAPPASVGDSAQERVLLGGFGSVADDAAGLLPACSTPPGSRPTPTSLPGAAPAHARPPLWMHVTEQGLTMHARLGSRVEAAQAAAAAAAGAVDYAASTASGSASHIAMIAMKHAVESSAWAAVGATAAAAADAVAPAVALSPDFSWALQAALYQRRIVQLAAGEAHTLALCAGPAAEVLSWGRGLEGQLGHGTRAVEVRALLPAALPAPARPTEPLGWLHIGRR